MSKGAKTKQKVPAEQTSTPSLPFAVMSNTGASMSIDQVAVATGVKVKMIRDYLDAREGELKEALVLQAQEKLWKAEDYIAVANILIAMYANKMAFRYTKANQKFLDNYNAAKEYVERVGIQKAYDQAHKEWGIELEFDSVDMNKEFGFGDHDFREDGFEGKSAMEIWDAAWSDADRISNILNTVSCALALKREFGFSSNDINKVIKVSNDIIKTAKRANNGISGLCDKLKRGSGIDVPAKEKELLKRYGL